MHRSNGRRRAPSRRAGQALILSVLAFTAGTSCGPRTTTARPTPEERPDVLLVSIDTLRADRLGCYGHAAAKTPVLDRLATEGALFESVTTTAPITLPAHASMLTGLDPPRHGVRDNVGFRLPDDVPTLAESMRANGYRTGAFIGGFPLDRSRGLAQGFDHYDDDMGTRQLGGLRLAKRPERYAEEVFAAASEWLSSSDSGEPAFAFIHLYDPHVPYEKPLPGELAPGYDGEIAYVDRTLGAFLESLDGSGRTRSRLTMVTSDHGEGLGDHGESTHCIFAYESTIRIPWIAHWPGIVGPRRIEGTAAVVDVTPTILDLVGLAPLVDADGVSVAAAVLDGAPIPQRDIYFESLFGELQFGWAPLRGVRREGWKLIDLPRRELYQVAEDPAELTNRYEDHPELATALLARLAEFGEGGRAEVAIDQQAREALASLGYLGAPPARGAGDELRRDPKDEKRTYDEFQRAHRLAISGDLEEPLAIMAELEKSLERSPYYWVERGNFASHVERWPLAIRCFRACLQLDPSHQDALLNLGVAYTRSGATDDARAQFEALLKVNPDHAKARLYTGLLLHQHYDEAGAAAGHLQRFLELAPDHREAAKVRRALGMPDGP